MAATELVSRGIALMQEEKLDEAADMFVEAAAAAAMGGNGLAEGRSFANLAVLESKRGNFEAATQYYARSLARFREAGDEEREVTTLYKMGLAYHRLGDLRRAVDCMRQCAEHRRREKADAAQQWLAAWASWDSDDASASRNNSSSLRLRRPMGAVDRRLPNANMMEYGFENLPFSDIMDRAEQSVARLDALAQLFEARALVEEKTAHALQEVHEGGRKGRTGSGKRTGLLASAFGGLNILHRNEVEVSSDGGTLQAAMDEISAVAAQDVSRHLQLGSYLRVLSQDLVDMRKRHAEEHKRLFSSAEEVVKRTKAASHALARANARLEKARTEEASAHEKLQDSHHALLQWREEHQPQREDSGADGSGGGGGGGGGGGEAPLSRSGKHQLAHLESVMHQRSQKVEAAVEESGKAERATREAATNLVLARNDREDRLIAVACGLQHLEEERLLQMTHSLSSFADGDRRLLEAALADHHEASPESDLRMFIHKRRVEQTLREHKEESRQRQVAAEDAARRRRGSWGASAGKSASSGPEEEDDKGFHVVPMSIPVSTKLLYSAENLRLEESLGPVVEQWVAALFRDEGAEFARRGGVRVWSTAGYSTDESSEELRPADGRSAGEGAMEAGTPPTEATDPVDVGQLFVHAAGRMLFLRSLNTRRTHQRELPNPAFHRLARVTWWFLDACRMAQDVASAKMMMIMSETFYRIQEESSGLQEFIQPRIASHPIWCDPQLWEEAFYRSIREQVSQLYNPRAQSAASSWVARSPKSKSSRDSSPEEDPERPSMEPIPSVSELGERRMSQWRPPREVLPIQSTVEPGSEEWDYVYENMLFGQLGSYTMNMRSFGLSEEIVQKVVTRLARGNGLPEEMRTVLLENAVVADQPHRPSEGEHEQENAGRDGDDVNPERTSPGEPVGGGGEAAAAAAGGGGRSPDPDGES